MSDISIDWLKENADRFERDDIHIEAFFEVEPREGNDGFVEVRVLTSTHPLEVPALEIITGVKSGEGWSTDAVGIGLYRHKSDLTDLLRILANGTYNTRSTTDRPHSEN